MEVLRTNRDLAGWRAGAPDVVLVPTMGALHEGHRSLIREAVRRGPAIVSIFVNPAQFNEKADFEAYPVTLDEDFAACHEEGAAAVYAPSVDEVYPPGVELPQPGLPEVAFRPRLEDAARPGHFEGVCRVLSRLFTLISPRAAVFGEKDWQQLQVTRALVRSEGFELDVIGAPIVRDIDGLALSSRNVRLSPADRSRATAIPRALMAACEAPTPAEAEAIMLGELAKADVDVAYSVVRDARTLVAPQESGPYRALIAGSVGGVHLLDNGPWVAKGMGDFADQ